MHHIQNNMRLHSNNPLHWVPEFADKLTCIYNVGRSVIKPIPNFIKCENDLANTRQIHIEFTITPEENDIKRNLSRI